jgi:crossover junction endodeoxyribonuclease RuvC
VLSFSAKRVKQSITGNGNASKLQVQRAVQNYFSLDRVPYPPDVADALAAALCYISSRKVVGKGQKSGVRSQKTAVGSKLLRDTKPSDASVT